MLSSMTAFFCVFATIFNYISCQCLNQFKTNKQKELHLSVMATILDVISGLINAIISNSKASC